jgi:orotidine-5'-phosphate decarboxylase
VHGADGWLCYEATCALARSLGMLVIGDVKRGDIGSTAEAYAQAHFAHADALTLHPYLGADSLEPFLRRCRSDQKGVFVLVRTSNPGARDLQDLRVGDGSLAEAVAARVHAWGKDLGEPGSYSPVGAVVGATWPHELAKLRALMPRAWFLLPGVGAQGAKAADVAPAFDARGLGALVNQSRGVLGCFEPDDPAWLDKIHAAATAFADEVRVASRSRS